MMNRRGLAVLIHPNTGRSKSDHLTHALWLGEILEIDAASLSDEEEAAAADFLDSFLGWNLKNDFPIFSSSCLQSEEDQAEVNLSRFGQHGGERKV